jgi:hypothetical protein
MKTLMAALLGLALAGVIAACDDTDLQDAQRIDMTISDQALEPGSAEAEAGDIELAITNEGESRRSVAVSGDQGQIASTDSIEPGQEGTLELNLDAGTYRVHDTENPAIESTLTVRDGTRTETVTERDTVTERETERETETEVRTETVPPEDTGEPDSGGAQAPEQTQTAP